MLYKSLCGLVAVILFLLYAAPVVVKLKEISLTVVVGLSAAMMLVDLWQSLQSKDD